MEEAFDFHTTQKPVTAALIYICQGLIYLESTPMKQGFTKSAAQMCENQGKIF